MRCQDAYDPWCKDMVHEGAYTELQVGPARTQMHTFPLPAGGSLEWTEWFKGKPLDAAKMQSEDYSVPQQIVGDWIKSPEGMPDSTHAKVRRGGRLGRRKLHDQLCAAPHIICSPGYVVRPSRHAWLPRVPVCVARPAGRRAAQEDGRRTAAS